MKFTLRALVVALLLVAGVAAYGQAAPPAPATPATGGQRAGFRHAWPGFRQMRLAMLKQLNLTPEQIQQIKQITSTDRTQKFDRTTAAANDREMLLKSIFVDEPNSAEIQKQMTEVQKAQASSLNQWVDTMTEINKVLTPDQRVQLVKMLDQQAQRRAQRRAQMHEKLAQPPASQPKPEAK